ncbi:LOW QUALITY PROTEIN: obscurin-like [Pecten maximus]|uniref:LOW QUALITY PROTEIN: obscurin-like n=1 Tax=Pecten maximus TaxID=6579 RepID=UPI001458128D|nr:LOW QUALITY PROTEIN: obscurin-like [Pecten maximus]
MDYMFRVRAHNQYGFSEASLPISLFRPIELDDDDVEYDDFDEEYRNTYNDTVPRSRLQRRTDEAPMKIEEAPPKLPMETPRLTDHGESAHLSWYPARIPAYAKKTPITYIVEVKEPPVQGWARTASGIVDTSFMVEGILPNRDYQFRIRAETQFGTSDPTLSAVLDRTKAQIQDSIEDEDDLEDYKPRKNPLVKSQRSSDPSSPLSPVNDFRPRKRLSNYASRLDASHVDNLSDEEDVFAPKARQSSKYSSSSRSYNERQSLRSTTSIDEDLYSRPQKRPSKPAAQNDNLLSDEEEELPSKSRFSKYSSRNKKSTQLKDYSLDEEDYSTSSKYSKYSSRSKKSSFTANYSSEEEDYLPRSRSSKYTQPKRYSFEDDLSDEEDYQPKPRSKHMLKKKYTLDEDFSEEEYEPFRPRYSSRSKRDNSDFYDDEPYSSRYKSRNYRSSLNDDSYESVIRSKFRSRRHTTDLSPLSMEAAELRSRRHHDDMPLSAETMSHGLWTRTSPPRTLDLPFTREFLEILKGSYDKKDKKPSTYSPDAPSSYKPAEKSSQRLQESSSTLPKEKSRLSSRDKRRNDPDDLPQAVYLDSVLTGVPPRMPSSRPMITNQAGNLLTLAWLPGRVPSYVKGSNMTYLVEMRKPPSHLWLKLIDNVEENEFDVYDLQEDQDYMFRVKAKNEFGCSEPTMPLSITRNKDDYIGTAVLSRSGSRGSLDSPWSRSRASSVDSLLESMPSKACKPEFKLREDTFYGAESRPVTISMQVKGFPLPKVRWYFQGRKLKLGNRYKSFIAPNGTATLEFSRMSEKDVGEYKCRAENDQGMSVRIFNLEMSDAPTFLEPLRNIVVDHRGCAKLECRVDGTPLPTVKFMRDWRPVTESSRVKIVHEAPDYWCLTIENTMSSDCGQYQCVAENVSGKAVSSAKITVEEKSAEERVPHSPGLHYREAPVEDFYYILEELGRGRHGIVRRVLDKSSGKQYAAKFIPVADPEMKHFFRQELYNLRAASHKNVVGVVDAFQSNRSLVIITELASGGELLDRVLSLDNWTESDAAFFIRQLLEVLDHLHQHQVYHLDIKPANIMLSAADSDEIKLIDFGLSRRVLADQSVRCNYGTPEFTSPEQVCNEVLSAATDIWSVGALAYLLVSGISAFQDRTDKDILSWVETCDWEFDDEGFELVSKEAKDFINKLLVLEPSERLTLEECMQHAWIKNATNRGQGPKLNIEHLTTFHKQNKKERLLGALQTCARVQSLKAIINDDLEEEDTGLYPLKDKTSGEMIYPDSQHYGKFLDQESWADWQVRYHQGGDTLLVPLAEPNYTARVREYKEAASESDYSEEGIVEWNDEGAYNPCLQKELEWALVAEEFKQQQQTPEELFDKEQVDPAKLPLFATKLRDHAFMPGETVTLTCRVQSEGTPSVNWFRNEEQVSEGNRLRTSLSEDGTATLTIELSKPFDEGVYKCVARNQAGKSTSWARVLVGGVTEEPGRPVVIQVSGSEALLVWEPPLADCNTPVTGYRVDYRKFGDESWTVAANVIDECCLVTGLLQGRSYRFRVSCVNKFGISPYSVASTEVKTRTDPDAKVTVDKYMAALLARQREVETRPSPASSRKGSEVNSLGLTLMEGSPEESYSFLNTLYSGGFSDLVCCRKSNSNTLYLGKIVPVQPDNMDATKHEYEILKTLCHERIVSMYECYLYKDSLYMVLEFLYGLNVIQHLSFKTKYTEDMVARVLRQVLDGVEYLQHEGVVHLNLQPSSVVMVSRRHLDIKLVDFSLARKVAQEGDVMTIEGFPEFIAPEVLAKEPTSFPADIWTIGTLAFLLRKLDSELTTLVQPFNKQSCVTEEPGRPVVIQVSGSEALLVWEPPMADCNTPVTGYRVDYRKFGDESWTVAANVIDECCLVTGLLQGRSYRFRVSCVNKFGISPYSVASTEVKTRTDPDAKVTVDKYMAALLARQREVETRPSPASSRKGSEVNSLGLTLMEGSPEESYSFLNTLYSGGFSDLVCCRKSNSNTLYLGKIVPVQPDNMDATKHEYEILKTLCHERIVSMYECYLYKDSLYMVLEFLYGLNVIQHLSFKTKYTEDMVARVLRQVLDGVEYLQHEGVVHLNLQPSSVVMVSRRHLDIKLVDFSLARKVAQEGDVMTIEGFPEFIAPEVLAKEPTSFPADIWTIGTLAFLLLSGESPFAAPTEKEVYSNIVYNRYDAHGLYENATREALKFVFQILKRTPRNRLTATRCLEDKWLQVTDVMTKCRKNIVFSTSKLRTFSRRYLVNRALDMYPMIHEETPSPISEEPEFDEEEEEEPTGNVVLDETEETSLKEDGSEEQPINNEVATVNLDEPIENDVIPESEESVENEVTLAVPEDSVDSEGKTMEGIEQLATDIVSSAMDEALQKPKQSSGDVNSEA